MSVSLSKIRSGSIVWAIVRDARGYRKRRPVVVLTPDAEIAADQPLALMAITTTYPDPPPSNCVELPWNPDRRKVTTGLARRSAAVLDWLESAYPDEIDELIGLVPPARMRVIMSRLREMGDES